MGHPQPELTIPQQVSQISSRDLTINFVSNIIYVKVGYMKTQFTFKILAGLITLKISFPVSLSEHRHRKGSLGENCGNVGGENDYFQFLCISSIQITKRMIQNKLPLEFKSKRKKEVGFCGDKFSSSKVCLISFLTFMNMKTFFLRLYQKYLIFI